MILLKWKKNEIKTKIKLSIKRSYSIDVIKQLLKISD